MVHGIRNDERAISDYKNINFPILNLVTNVNYPAEITCTSSRPRRIRDMCAVCALCLQLVVRVPFLNPPKTCFCYACITKAICTYTPNECARAILPVMPLYSDAETYAKVNMKLRLMYICHRKINETGRPCRQGFRLFSDI